jgi:hypothetical protein
MRKWIILVVTLPMLWAAYWFFGSYGLKSEINTWLTDRQEDGWQVEYSNLKVRGFPNRFDTTLSDIQLTDPDTGISWAAPFVQFLSLSYKPNHVIAVWPMSQTFSTPYQKIEVSSAEMKASAVLSPDHEMKLLRGTLIANDLALKSTSGWDIGVSSISTSIRQLELPESYEFSTSINSLEPSETLRKWLGETRNLPAKINNITLDFTTELTRTLDRTTIEDARPQIKTLDLTRASASWGELLIRASGKLTVGIDGNLNGELELNAKHWKEMLQLAVSAGAISSEIAAAAELGLSFMARLNGSDQALDTTLTFRDGRIFLGPIPLGTAPKLIIR